jgi:hypothetical protein
MSRPLPELSPKEWGLVAQRLQRVASKMMSMITGRAKPEDVEDVVQTSILQLYDENHIAWDPQRDPDVTNHLARAIPGIIKNRRKKGSTRNERVVEEGREWGTYAAEARTPEDEAADRDEAIQIMDGIEKELADADDADGLKIAACERRGNHVAADQRDETGLEIEEVRRARRRFFDAAERVQKELAKTPERGGRK